MDEQAEKELIDYYSLKETEFYPDFVSHTVTKRGRVKWEQDITAVEQWSRLKKLDHGSFGTVYLEQERSGALRAVKVLQKRNQVFEASHYLRELLALAAFTRDERNFVKFYGWYEDVEQLYIAMEYCELGNLLACVKGPLPEQQTCRITWQVASGLKLMHEQQFTHRDINPSNILVQSSGPIWWVKIADFGISKRLRPGASSMYTSFHGDYVAPEIINLVDEDDDDDEWDVYTNKVDIWSLGCLVHWLITYKKPFAGPPELKRYCKGYYKGTFGFPEESLQAAAATKNASKFIRSLLLPRPRERLSARQALENPWLQLAFNEKILTSASKSTPLKPSRPLHSVREERPLSVGTGTIWLDKNNVSRPNQADQSKSSDNLQPAIATQVELRVQIGKDNPSQHETTGGNREPPVNGQIDQVPADEKPADEKLTDENLSKDKSSDEKSMPTIASDSIASHVADAFKRFGAQEKTKVREQITEKKKAERSDNLQQLKKFSEDFILKTNVPKDLLPILAKDETKQDQILALDAGLDRRGGRVPLWEPERPAAVSKFAATKQQENKSSSQDTNKGTQKTGADSSTPTGPTKPSLNSQQRVQMPTSPSSYLPDSRPGAQPSQPPPYTPANYPTTNGNYGSSHIFSPNYSGGYGYGSQPQYASTQPQYYPLYPLSPSPIPSYYMPSQTSGLAGVTPPPPLATYPSPISQAYEPLHDPYAYLHHDNPDPTLSRFDTSIPGKPGYSFYHSEHFARLPPYRKASCIVSQFFYPHTTSPPDYVARIIETQESVKLEIKRLLLILNRDPSLVDNIKGPAFTGYAPPPPPRRNAPRLPTYEEYYKAKPRKSNFRLPARPNPAITIKDPNSGSVLSQPPRLENQAKFIYKPAKGSRAEAAKATDPEAPRDTEKNTEQSRVNDRASPVVKLPPSSPVVKLSPGETLVGNATPAQSKEQEKLKSRIDAIVPNTSSSHDEWMHKPYLGLESQRYEYALEASEPSDPARNITAASPKQEVKNELDPRNDGLIPAAQAAGPSEAASKTPGEPPSEAAQRMSWKQRRKRNAEAVKRLQKPN